MNWKIVKVAELEKSATGKKMTKHLQYLDDKYFQGSIKSYLPFEYL